MNIALWIIQGLLALMFIGTGATKLQYERAKKSLPWASDYSKGFVAFIGIVEVLGGIGLILPLALGIAPILTPLAAIGLLLIMVFAAIFHGKRGEYKMIGSNIVVIVLALFVTIGRF
ncbi:DoxX family protein [Oceanobacillus arenosus]|uniref:DoxX family protein n=1 Tax=Oceanobacillus arenosus TaxID=1229153 RepID=A0A3D8PIX6_9BACI|nr:DoxX family protein [Oceanobacillus arenosus]RDW15178.1 DoxX family protein [Oceanobacillus arenosus]